MSKALLLKQKQLLFFMIAGGICATLEIVLFKLFSVVLKTFIPAEEDFFGIHYPLSNILSTTLAILLNYFLSIWFVFQRGRHSKKKEFAYFMVTSLVATLLSLLFFQIFYRYIVLQHLDLGFIEFSREILSKIFAITVVAAINYLMKKRMVFSG